MISPPHSPPALYRAFGLALRSALPLPELLPLGHDAPVDAEVVFGPVPAALPGVLAAGLRYQANATALRLQVDGVATYLVEDGRRITIARGEGAEDADVRLFLLGSALSALLHQRGDLVLHGSAIEWEGEAVAFLGASGLGKSTLAAAFRRRGRSVLTDDLCVVRPGADGRMYVHPGFPQAKLWLDSLKELEVPAEGLQPIRRKLEKRAVPLVESFAAAPRPLRRLYVLRIDHREELKLEPVTGPGKFVVLRNQTYRFGFVAGPDRKSGHFQHAMRLAQQTPLVVVTRTWQLERLGDLVAAIEADLRA
jgi:hypothetical protein